MTQEHLDAELVAAWADGSLDPQARTEAEAHAADCMRCQAMLAAIVRTEPAAGEPARGWLGARVRWLVPLATAAAAAALWVGLSRDLLAPGSPPQIAGRMERAAEAVSDRAAATPTPVATPQPMEASTREVPSGAGTRQRVADVPSERAPAAKSARVVTGKPGAVAETVTIDTMQRDALTGRPPAAAPAPSTPPPPPPVAVQTESVPAQSQTQVMPSQTQTAQSRTQVAQTASRQAAFSTDARAPRDVASPDPAVRYRVGAQGLIQRSGDGGKTWVAQKSPVTFDLLAASAPSPDVCWIVGRSGVVLLTTDGATWRRLPFPEPADLRAVVATDVRTATVTTGDGRVFRTFDGGVTWRQ